MHDGGGRVSGETVDRAIRDLLPSARCARKRSDYSWLERVVDLDR
jgi:hypothetical protein